MSKIQEVCKLEVEICSGTNEERKIYFSVLPCDWSPRPHAAVQTTRYNNMAASEGDHRVQKSPAAAQRPPHLKALEVFVGRV